MSESRFEVRFDPDAKDEYDTLDNSVIDMVDDFIEKLETRADEIGKPLQNKHATRLHGCKEFKLKKAGIRIVFRVTEETVDILKIVYILTIEKRDADRVFRVANVRLTRFRGQADRQGYLRKTEHWNGRRRAGVTKANNRKRPKF